MLAVYVLAFATGFISLSIEILWIRLFAFANYSMPQAFAFVLAFYLIGIAIGAYIGKLFCRRDNDLWVVGGLSLMIASAFNLLGPWMYAGFFYPDHQLIAGGVIMLISALLLSIIFPIAHHLGTPLNGPHAGRSLSHVYVSNIIGATLGPLFTGLIVLQIMTLQQAFILYSMITLLAAICCLYKVLGRKLFVSAAFLFTAQLLALFSLSSSFLIAKLAFVVPDKFHLKTVLENRYGIITVYQEDNGESLVFGGNVYDGTTNLDPIYNSNHINRVIVMSALVPHPKKVLMIGLSIGTWLKLVTTFPDVESIDVIEINPGYQTIIANDYPLQHSALQDSRVHLYNDDGRRWLKMHPENYYDMVIINTTFHWRAYTTNLLSKEFLTMIKRHMNPGAVMEFNTTDSPDAVKTADAVFKYVYLYENFIIAADFDWARRLKSKAAVRKLADLKMDGKTLYLRGSEAVITRQVNEPLVKLEQIEPWYNYMGRKLEVITDLNVITEYKYGKNIG